MVRANFDHMKHVGEKSVTHLGQMRAARKRLQKELRATTPSPEKPPRRAGKGDPIAKGVAAVAPELAKMLLDSWPGLNAPGLPDGGYAMARGVIAEVFYGELAAAYRMSVDPIERGADDGMQRACALLRARIRELPLEQITPEHFGCVHEALAGHHFEAGRCVRNDGRRKTGTHYTPPDLAMKVTSRTVEPLLACIGDRSPLLLRICDPAVGAGVFLLALMRMLAPRVVERGEAASLTEAKRLVAIHCCYGVDKSRFAVHSCKLAMTLEARADRMPRDWLDDNIKHGDALVGLSSEQIKAFHWKRERAAVPFLDGLVDRASNEAAHARQARIADLSRAARGAA